MAQAELLRTTCAVLLRRILVPSNPYWARLGDAEKNFVRDGLLLCLGEEQSKSIARKVYRAFPV